MLSRKMLTFLTFTPGPKGRMGLPAEIQDDPGIGKSTKIEAFAESYDFPCFVLSPGEMGEGIFGVAPWVDPQTKRLTYPKPDWVDEVFGDGVGLLFIDEATTADPLLQRPIMRLVCERSVAGYYLGDGVRVLLASNAARQVGGHRPNLALRNRYGHFKGLGVSSSEWCDWLMDVRDDRQVASWVAEEARVMALWADAWSRSRALFSSFIASHSDHLLRVPSVQDDSDAWASPRTWELGARAWAGASVHGLDAAERLIALTAFVGEGAAREFSTYQATLDLPSAHDVLLGSVRFAHDRSRPDKTHATLQTLTAYITDRGLPIAQLSGELGVPASEVQRTLSDRFWALARSVESQMPLDLLARPARQMVAGRCDAGPDADAILATLQPILSGMRNRPADRRSA